MSLGLELSYTGRDTKSTLASLCCQQTLQASCFLRRRQRCSFPSLVPHNGMGYRRGLPKRESPAPAAKGLIWLLLQVLEEQMNKEPVGTGICANNMGTETVLLSVSVGLLSQRYLNMKCQSMGSLAFFGFGLPHQLP